MSTVYVGEHGEHNPNTIVTVKAFMSTMPAVRMFSPLVCSRHPSFLLTTLNRIIRRLTRSHFRASVDAPFSGRPSRTSIRICPLDINNDYTDETYYVSNLLPCAWKQTPTTNPSHTFPSISRLSSLAAPTPDIIIEELARAARTCPDQPESTSSESVGTAPSISGNSTSRRRANWKSQISAQTFMSINPNRIPKFTRGPDP